jgi:sialate O-acetylesterase
MTSLKFVILPFFLLSCSVMTSQISLPKIIGSGMVLQRDENVKIWGWASAGENVTLVFNKKKYNAKTAPNGVWLVNLQPANAGGPYTMQITGKNAIELNDILIGDVWVCAGQSNMAHQMRLHNVRYAEDIAKADDKQIRQFFVENTTNLNTSQKDVTRGSWKTATAENIGDFSAVAYFFAKKLYEKNGVPVGIINASWGGTPIESWISENGFKEFPAALELISKNKDTAYIAAVQRPSNTNALVPEDKGITGQWYTTKYLPKGWRTIAVPGYWEDQGVRDLDGVVWYRREIEIPKSFDINHAKTFMGRIVDADEVYINGTKIGNTTYMYPQRRYEIPTGVLHTGKNLFVVRVTNNSGKGGFVPDKPYQLIAANDTLDLTGYWHYKVGRVNIPTGRMTGAGINLQNQPTALYNTMIAPFINYKIKGFVWYQGESNTGRPEDYTNLQRALIQDWRAKWNKELPFLFVQLPGFMDYRYLPSESQWAEFREAQAKTLSVPKTGMAVAIDLGEWNDIHPDRKKEVGERLALVAENIVYGKNVTGSPYYTSVSAKGNEITVMFNNTGKGLTTSDGETPAEFAIAGADKKFVWAKAKIEGSKIILWNDDIKNPVYVRYAWADNPVNPNVINTDGLPAAPFRTDTN